MTLIVATLVSLGASLQAGGAPAAQGPGSQPPPRDVVPTASLLADAPTAVIRKDGLSLTVALPDAQRGFYRSTRFDWSGMVLFARIGTATFYGPWFDGVAENVRDVWDGVDGVVVGPRNAATGPAEEFANRDGETVPGYNAAPAGGTFIKIGVGRLRKADALPYDHFRGYQIVDGGVWSIRRTADRIVFRQRLEPDATGYGYVYEKTLTLTPGGGLTISHRLRNLGSKPIHTQIYTHNFARFDGAEIGLGVTASFPYAPTGPVSEPALAMIDGNALKYVQPIPVGKRVQLPAQAGGQSRPSGPFEVVGANGASIVMTGDTPLVRTVLWSMRRTVAVEPFVAIDVPVGAEQRWSWRYVYSARR